MDEPNDFRFVEITRIRGTEFALGAGLSQLRFGAGWARWVFNLIRRPRTLLQVGGLAGSRNRRLRLQV